MVLAQVKRIDLYNCGVHILHFAQQLIANKSLTGCTDPNTYRNYVKNLNLKNSDNMTKRCVNLWMSRVKVFDLLDTQRLLLNE